MKNINNYFKLFQLPPIYNLNKNLLKTNYNELQKIYHPDKFLHSKSILKQNEYNLNDIQTISANINKGYHTLRHDQSRMYYVFNTYSNKQIENIPLDQDFILKQYELREQLEESDNIIKDKIEGNIKEEYVKYIYNLESIMNNKDLTNNSINWDEVGNYLKKIQFYKSFEFINDTI
jgi:molecular chaperone HscB